MSYYKKTLKDLNSLMCRTVIDIEKDPDDNDLKVAKYIACRMLRDDMLLQKESEYDDGVLAGTVKEYSRKDFDLVYFNIYCNDTFRDVYDSFYSISHDLNKIYSEYLQESWMEIVSKKSKHNVY